MNDYRLDPAYEKLLESLRENGRWPFDAIGLQSHMHDGGWPLRQVWDHCERYRRFGVPLHFTETTIVSGNYQLRVTAQSSTTFTAELLDANGVVLDTKSNQAATAAVTPEAAE